MTVHSHSGASRVARKVGYSVTALVNVIMLILVNGLFRLNRATRVEGADVGRP